MKKEPLSIPYDARTKQNIMQDYLISDRERLVQLISRRRPRFSGKIRMELPQFSPEENAKYGGKFNDWHEACGCELGAVFVFVALAGFAIYAGFFAEAVHWPLIRKGLIILFSAAAIGKVIGIVAAKVLLRRTVGRLAARLARP